LRLEPLEDRTVPSGTTAGNSQVLQAYGQLPLTFEANRGQTAAPVNFLSRGRGYTLFLTPAQAVLALSQGSGEDVLRMQLVGANPAAQAVGLDQQAGVSNYLFGSDPSQWITNVPNYGRVEYQDPYPDINLVYYGNSQTQLEYDFDVAPGANPAAIQLAFQGALGMTVDAQGNLVLHTAGGDVVEQAPVAYQLIGGVRQAVAVRYVLGANGQVGFALGAYDPSRALTIDPVLSYSTFLGGSLSTGYEQVADAIAVDSAGNAYVTGFTFSTDFPTTAGAFQTTDPGPAGRPSAFVAKLNASGTALVYCTYLGSSGGAAGATAIAVDGAGDAYVTGSTDSANFPTTPGAYQTTNRGLNGSGNAFITELNALGSGLVYSTFLGGDSGAGAPGTGATGIAVDGAGSAYVVGNTTSTDFPTTTGAPQTALLGYSDAFVAKLNAGGSALLYGTYLGGSGGRTGSDRGSGIAVDSAGDAYVTGFTESADFPTTPGAFQTRFGGSVNAFVTVVNPSGTAWVYSTYLGGSSINGDRGAAIAVDSAGDAYVTGDTYSDNFPTTAGAFQTTLVGFDDTFVTKLNPAGSGLFYSTYLGSSALDLVGAIAVDSAGNAYVTGDTSSASFPTTVDAFQPTDPAPAGTDIAFVTELNGAGSALRYSTYLGGSGGAISYRIAVDSAGDFYVTGGTGADFPTTPGAFQTTAVATSEGFVAKFTGSITVSPTALPPATVGTGYSQALTASGGAGAPYTFAVTGGSPPPGLSLSAGGVLSGTPTAAGSSTFTVTATDSTRATGSQTYTLTVSLPTLTLSGFPSPATAGVAGTFTVTALNADGTTDTSYTGTVHFTSTDPRAVLPGNYTFAAADHGAHTFTATLKTAGRQSITATDPANSSIMGRVTVLVTPASAAALVISGVPSSTRAGSAFPLTLTARDAYGNTMTGYTGTVHFTSSDARAVLPADYTFTGDDAGQHTFRATLQTAGPQSVTATDTVMSGLTATARDIVVTPAAADHLAFVQQPTDTVAGAAISPAVTVQVLDRFGNLTTTSAGVTVSLSGSPSGASLGGTRTQPAVGGVATFDDLSITRAGTGYRLTATAPGLSRITSAAFAVMPAAADHLAFVQPPADTTMGQPINAGASSAGVQVSIFDRFNNLLTADSGDTVTLAIGSGSGGNLSGTRTQPVHGGVAVFGDLSIDIPGAYTLQASGTSRPGLAAAASPAFAIQQVPVVAGPPMKVRVVRHGHVVANEYMQVVSLYSTTDQSVAGPFSLVLEGLAAQPMVRHGRLVLRDTRIRLLNAAGSVLGSPFVSAVFGGQPGPAFVAPWNEGTTFVLWFSDPLDRPIVYTPLLLARALP
jgi:hypothetical protein